jgi:hypothetical protein
MSRIRTANDIQDWLDKESAWRIKEILHMKSSLRMDNNAGRLTKTLVRAGVALLYAHWEGFVKKSSETYLEFVSNQNLPYSKLKPCLVVFGLKKELNFVASSRNHHQNTRIVEFLIKELDRTAALSYQDTIKTNSNLNSAIFESIAASIGIDSAPYSTKYTFIDEELLKRRNSIAHGDYLEIGAQEFDKLSVEVIDLIKRYKTDIENCVGTKSYTT